MITGPGDLDISGVIKDKSLIIMNSREQRGGRRGIIFLMGAVSVVLVVFLLVWMSIKKIKEKGQ